MNSRRFGWNLRRRWWILLQCVQSHQKMVRKPCIGGCVLDLLECEVTNLPVAHRRSAVLLVGSSKHFLCERNKACSLKNLVLKSLCSQLTEFDYPFTNQAVVEFELLRISLHTQRERTVMSVHMIRKKNLASIEVI